MFCHGFGAYGPFSAYGWMPFVIGLKLLIFIGIIYLAVKLLKKYTNHSNDNIKIIDQKFAKGEISEEEYLRKKEILSQKN